MKKTLKIIVDITMVIALVAAIGLTVYLLLFSNNAGDDGSLSSEGNVQGNSTVVTRRGS